MLNITTEQKDLKLAADIDHLYMFNSKVFRHNIVYQRNCKEWIEEKKGI